MAKSPPPAPTYSGFGASRQRPKADWAGTSRGDAFKENLSHSLRLPAQARFYRDCTKAQRRVRYYVSQGAADGAPLKMKPQISPCHSDYPSAGFCASAAIGLTAYLEFAACQEGPGLLTTHLKDYLADPATQDAVPVEPKAYARLARWIIRTIETRLYLDDLARQPGHGTIEAYRLFAAGIQSLKFESLREIVRAVVLYGDLLPPIEGPAFHPQTVTIASAVRDACEPHRQALSQETRVPRQLAIAATWARGIAKALAPHLECAQRADGQPKRKDSQAQRTLPPLNEPRAPRLDGSRDRPLEAEQLSVLLPAPLRPDPSDDTDGDSPDRSAGLRTALDAIAQRFKAAADAATRQARDWEDLRVDLLERQLMLDDYQRGPLEGTPGIGHEVMVSLSGEGKALGEIFDCALEPSDDQMAYQALLADSDPLVAALRGQLYPNLEEQPATERFRSSGAIDPTRLPLAGLSDAVFKRQQINLRLDQRGRAVLLIACDGSGSLNALQMKMVKLLAAGWLRSTAGTGVELLAALYHSGRLHRGTSGPLVRWIYHPTKTPTVGRADAVRSLLSLPVSGTGIQSDALSLSFMLQEARRLARGARIYAIVISDCAWNKSFGNAMSGEEEVRDFFETAYGEMARQLHVSLVALGTKEETGFEEALDQVIPVTKSELSDVQAVAARVALYVARTMRSHRRDFARMR